MVKVRINMSGWKMWEHGVSDSRLTIIKQTEDYISTKGKHEAQWLCQCSCGSKPIIVRQCHLKNGNTTSCGCVQKERTSIVGKLNHKINKYDLSGEYGIGWTLNTDAEFYFSLEDYDIIKEYGWYEHILSSGYHALEALVPNTKNIVRMQWVIVGKHYDHINRNPLDNRRENLRVATIRENVINASIGKNNKSGIIGVYFHKRDNIWISTVNINDKQQEVGRYVNKNDAIKARLQAEAKYYGEFAPQRHLFEQYGITQQND